MVFKLASKVIMNVSKVRKWDTERQILYNYIYFDRDTPEYCALCEALHYKRHQSAYILSDALSEFVFKRLAKGDGGKI